MNIKIFPNLSLKKSEYKLWLGNFAILCLVHSFLICHFVWGNHDWYSVVYGNGVAAGLIEGRFSQYFITNLLLDGQIFPLVNVVLGFMAYALALTLLYTRFFVFKYSPWGIFTLAAVNILPYIVEILYFQFIVLSQLLWPLIITISLLAAKKAGTSQWWVLWSIFSGILMFAVIGGYPAAVNLYLTAALLYLLQNIPKKPCIKQVLRQALPFAFSLILAFGALYLVHMWLRKHHLMMDMYNNQPLSIKNLILKIPFMYIAALQSLLQVQPYLSLSLKLVMTIIIILCLAYIVICSSYRQRIFRLVLFMVLPLCLKFSAWLINENPDEYFAQHDPAIFMLRTDFYAIPVLVLFCLNFNISKASRIIKNIMFVLTILLLVDNLNAAFHFGKTQVLGKSGEALLQQRINNRILEHPAFNFRQNYFLLQAGEIPFRPRYYQKHELEKYGYYTLQIPSTRYWLPAEFYAFYEPENFVLSGEAIHPEDISHQMIDFLMMGVAAWPAANSLYVDKQRIIVVLTSEGKSMLKQQFNQLGLNK